MQSASSSRNIVMDFYLPCAVSGFLLAGLIALTSPADATEFADAGAPAIVAMMGQP